MILNCINCGAPIDNTKTKCPYCDTPYKLNGFTGEISEESNRGVLNIGGHFYDDYLSSVEVGDYGYMGYRDATGRSIREVRNIHRTLRWRLTNMMINILFLVDSIEDAALETYITENVVKDKRGIFDIDYEYAMISINNIKVWFCAPEAERCISPILFCDCVVVDVNTAKGILEKENLQRMRKTIPFYDRSCFYKTMIDEWERKNVKKSIIDRWKKHGEFTRRCMIAGFSKDFIPTRFEYAITGTKLHKLIYGRN